MTVMLNNFRVHGEMKTHPEEDMNTFSPIYNMRWCMFVSCGQIKNYNNKLLLHKHRRENNLDQT